MATHWHHRQQGLCCLNQYLNQNMVGKDGERIQATQGIKEAEPTRQHDQYRVDSQHAAEASTKDISQANNPNTFDQSMTIAKQGGNVAKVAREELERQTGKSVISSDNAATLRRLTQNTQHDEE